MCNGCVGRGGLRVASFRLATPSQCNRQVPQLDFIFSSDKSAPRLSHHRVTFLVMWSLNIIFYGHESDRESQDSPKLVASTVLGTGTLVAGFFFLLSQEANLSLSLPWLCFSWKHSKCQAYMLWGSQSLAMFSARQGE